MNRPGARRQKEGVANHFETFGRRIHTIFAPLSLVPEKYAISNWRNEFVKNDSGN
jgi:hypothetical protein